MLNSCKYLCNVETVGAKRITTLHFARFNGIARVQGYTRPSLCARSLSLSVISERPFLIKLSLSNFCHDFRSNATRFATVYLIDGHSACRLSSQSNFSGYIAIYQFNAFQRHARFYISAINAWNVNCLRRLVDVALLRGSLQFPHTSEARESFRWIIRL